MPRKPKETPHLRVRIEPALLTRLEKAREKNGRTLTGEIVHRLEQSFQKDDTRDFLNAQAEQITERLLAAVSGDREAALKPPDFSKLSKFKGDKS